MHKSEPLKDALLTLVFIKGEEDECAVVVELRVSHERDQPVAEPVADEVDRSIMALKVL